MTQKSLRRWSFVVVSVLSVGLLIWPTAGGAQGNRTTFSGRAVAITGMVFGRPVIVSDTGSLPSSGGAEEASLFEVNIPGLRAEIFHASTIGQGDRSRSEATAADMRVAGNTIFAEFLRAWAETACAPGGPTINGGSEIAGLVMNGQGVVITGQPNQVVPISGGQLIINEQIRSQSNQTGDITVNALHIIMPGVDVIFSSAHADITCRGNAGRGDQGDFVTGGGWINGPSGAKANFSVAGGLKKNDLWGHLTYNDHSGPMVKGTGVTAYTVTGSASRHIEGMCEINNQAGFTYQVDVTDNGEPGGNDFFMLRLSNGYTAAGNLGGGNIQLHTP